MTTAAPAQPATPSAAMVVTLGGIAMLAGLLVVLVYHLTLPHIEANRRALLERSVFDVLPGANTRRDFVLAADGAVPAAAAEGGRALYAGYDDRGRLVGVAIPAEGQGYQDTIRILYGFDPACDCIIGMAVLGHKETPGLGDKIVDDPDFHANFDGLVAKVEGDGLVHAIETVKHGEKDAAWEIDAISGATISSRAIGEMMNKSAQRLLPELVRQLDALTSAPIAPQAEAAPAAAKGK